MFLDNFSNKLLTTKISIKNTPNLTVSTIWVLNKMVKFVFFLIIYICQRNSIIISSIKLTSEWRLY